MVRILFSFLIVFVFFSKGFSQVILKKGDVAPDFTGRDQDEKNVTLSQFRGKKVILYFYPKDNTPGCTAEACNLRDNSDSLSKAGFVILGVSSDDEVSHKEFKAKYALPFSLIADKDKAIHSKYGVWIEKEREGKKIWGTARTTFVLDEKGVIIAVIDKVETSQHARQILNY